MVKRAPTPPPPDDEPRYLAVACPFPPYADMENYQELVAFVRWLACAMKGEYNSLYAVFHKPSAANMIVIEVSRAFPHFRNLLGAHYWSQFLLNPKSYSNNVSRIYFSTYPNGRAVEKAGWKRIFVEDVWFEGWHPQNHIVAYPYPISSYCPVPLEDPISVETCRPLSVDMFNVRVSTIPPPVPVGSSTWVARKVDNGDKNVEGNDATLLDHKRSRVLSHSPLEPVVSNDDLTKAVTTRQTSLKSSIITSTASGFRSDTPFTERSMATGTSGIAFTVNGGTIPWDYESDGEKESSSAVFGATDEFENDNYGADIYFKTESRENEESATSFQPASVHPLLANRDKPSCPTHGAKCKTTICKDYSSLIRKSNKIHDQEKKRREMGNGLGRSKREEDRGTWVGGGHGSIKHKTAARDKFGKTNGAVTISAHSRPPKAASRIDEGSSDNEEDKVYNTAALSESLSQGSNSVLSTRSISSVRSVSTYSASGTSEVPDTPPSRTLSMSPTNAWAKGNPLTMKRDQPSGENGIFVADTGDKSDKLDSLRGSGVTSPTFAGSVKDAPTGRSSSGKVHVTASRANENPTEGTRRSASVASWAKVASLAPSPPRSVGSASYERNAPPSIGKVITSFDKRGPRSNAPLTVPWEDLIDKEVEEEEQW